MVVPFRHPVMPSWLGLDDYDAAEAVALVPAAARDIDQALLDIEIGIHRTISMDDAIQTCLGLPTDDMTTS